MRRKARDIGKVFSDGAPIDRALRKSAREARLLHKRAGMPLVIWKDGRIRWVKPEDIRL